MLGFGSLAKLASGMAGAEDFAKMLKGMGMELEMSPVPFPEASDSFTDLARSMSRPGAKLYRLRGKMKNGDRQDVLMVLVPAEIPTRALPQGVLTLASGSVISQ